MSLVEFGAIHELIHARDEEEMLQFLVEIVSFWTYSNRGM